MAKCKCCGGTVWSGVLLHTHCFEQLRPVWHPEVENPESHVEFLETDDGAVAYHVSDEVLVKDSDGWRGIARLHYDDDDRAWLTHDGTPVDVVAWMPIPD